MDPAILELLRTGPVDGSQEIEAILRLDHPEVNLPGVRIVSRFGPIVTCRLRQDSILRTYAEEHVGSMKKPRRFGEEPDHGGAALRLPNEPLDSDIRRPPGLPLRGRRVVVGIVDWGCDFDYPGFKHLDGSTRLLALWDQRGHCRRGRPNRYGYGTVYRSEHINRALASNNPYAALGYFHSDADSGGGTHGTHVMDIAAGNGRGGGPTGIAPDADLVFVHLATGATAGLANLGDSGRILEAIDFIRRVAGDRPWVVNLSVGSHGGPHDGRTLAEMALDYMLSAAPNCFAVLSGGNYYERNIHASGTLEQGQERSLHFDIDPADFTPNELEVWYSGRDVFAVRIDTASGISTQWVEPGGQAEVVEAGRSVGRIYNRAHDPNNGDNHIDVFLYPGASAGRWAVRLRADRIVDGTFHAWLERDEACARCQVQFLASESDSSHTTGTLANGRIPLVVGAYDAHTPGWPVASFSSCGPTRGLVPKPDLVAPGFGVLAARSAPAGALQNPGEHVRKSGTSMAAPSVTGLAALCFEGAGRPLESHEIRALILDNTDAAEATGDDALRYGCGYMNIERTVQAVLSSGGEPKVFAMGPAVNRQNGTIPQESAETVRATTTPVRARILWPALGFPAVIAPQNPTSDSPFKESDATRSITILLVCDRKSLSKAEVAQSLRYVPWSGRGRRNIPAGQAGSFDEVDIHVNVAGERGLVLPDSKDALGELIGFGGDREGRKGITVNLSGYVREFYRKEGLPFLHEVRISERASARLQAGQYHLFWNNEKSGENVPSDEMRLLIDRFARPRREKLGELWALNRDYLINEYEYEFGVFHPPYYSPLAMRRPRAEVLHPLIVQRSGTTTLRLGHLTDIHVDVRADVYEENLKQNRVQARYNNWNKSFRKLYEHAAGTNDALFLTGDLIDYGRGHWGLPSRDQLGNDTLYHADRNWFLFYYLIAAGEQYRKPVYTILGNHDWRINPYPPFAPGAPGPNALLHDSLRFTATEKADIIRKAHGPGHDRKLSYYGETEDEFVRLMWENGTLVRALGKLLTHQSALDEKHTPVETTVESVAWYLLSINPFLDYSFSLPTGQSALMLDWAEDEDVLFPIVRDGKEVPYMLWQVEKAADPGPKTRNALTRLQLRLVEDFASAPGKAKIVGVHAPPIGLYPDWSDDDLLRGRKTYAARGGRGTTGYGIRKPDGTVERWNGHPIFAIRPKGGTYGMVADYGSLGKGRSEFIDRVADARSGIRLVLSGHIHRNGLYVVHTPAGDPRRSAIAGQRLVRGVIVQAAQGARPPAVTLTPEGQRGPLYVNTTSAGPRGHFRPRENQYVSVDPGYARIELATDGTIREVVFERLGALSRRPVPATVPAPIPAPPVPTI